MLLQSHENKIRVFPAVPSGFPAAFTLRAEGAFIISSVIDSLGVIPFVEVESLAGSECRVQNPWGDEAVRVVTQNSRSIKVKVDKDNVLCFKTEAGESYTIRKKNADAFNIPETYRAARNMPSKKYGEAILGKECTFRPSKR